MAEKDFEPGDPMGLVGVGVPEGEPDLMAECLVEEYVRLGTSDAQLLAIFKNPFFAGAHALYRARGEDHLKAVIERARAQWGRPRFTTTEVGGPDMAPHAPQGSEAPRQSRGAPRGRDSFTDSEVGGPDMAPHAPQRSEAPRQSRGAPRGRDSFADSESTEA